jgi:hypothetical protein
MGVSKGLVPSLASWFALAICVATPALGQVVLEGHVLDDVTRQRIGGSRVLLINAQSRTVGFVVTDDSGYFRFSRPDNGWYRLEVAALGYQRTRTPFIWWMVDHSYAALEVRLAPHVSLLAPVEIVALSPANVSPVLENVVQRRTAGFGVQISRQQIEARHPANISDMLIELPGVYAARTGSGAGGRRLYMGRALLGGGGGPCPAQIFLDGKLATRNVPGGDVQVDELVMPIDVETIEVFRGLGTIPPEFLTPDARCGVIAIWTKRFTE